MPLPLQTLAARGELGESLRRRLRQRQALGGGRLGLRGGDSLLGCALRRDRVGAFLGVEARRDWSYIERKRGSTSHCT